MQRSLAASLALCVFGGTVRAQAPAPVAIDSMAIRAHTRFLAHDLLQGRGTGTRGGEIAAEYLAAAARSLGLRPAPGTRDFFQDVPIVDAVIDSAGTKLVVNAGSLTETTSYSPRAFIPNVGTARSLRGFSGPVAWVGRAADIITHPDRLPELAGRVALMAGMFGADLAAADTLRVRGATGVIHFVGDEATYRLYVHSRGTSRMYLADSNATSSFIAPIPTVIGTASLFRQLLPPITSDSQLDRPFEILNRHVDVSIRTHPRALPARNVVAWLPGSNAALRSEYVVYTAHYDHLGIGEPENGDTIYNGFSDNAAGSAMLLAIAGALAAHPPERSVLFIWFTGEERGLLGSDYFVAHPMVPLASINGVINLDAGAPPAPPSVWRISGADRSQLGRVAIDVASSSGWEGQAAPASPNTDYFPFLRSGVPAVFLVPGPGPFEGLTTDSSQALRRRWDHYHQAADHWSADFPFAGLVRYATFALRLGLRIGSGARLPPAR